MPRILIIADDLTGAADCAAMFAEHGWKTAVLLAGPAEFEERPLDWQDAEVLSIDANTRCLAPETAAARVAQLVHGPDTADKEAESVLIFKKVDSTLRGNVGFELAAALKARREGAWSRTNTAVLFAPAFPACGRTTVHGRQFARGRRLEDSDEWMREPGRPHGDIAELLGAAGLSWALVDLASVRGDSSELERAISALTSEADVVICDAETDTDLGAIVRAGLKLNSRVLWAGSAGLARQISGELSFGRSTLALAMPHSRGPALFVVGSPAEPSQEQARTLAAAKGVGIFTFGARELLQNGQGCEIHEKTRRICEQLQRQEDVLVHYDSRDGCRREQGRQLAESLAHTLAPCAEHVSALAATGGETARAILDAWGIRRMRVLGEVEPGLPYSIARSGKRKIVILTKAGGFGTRDTLVRCREFIRSHPVTEIRTANMQKAIIAITMGDAAGVGPEVIVKSLARRDVYEQCRPLVIGDAGRLRQADRICATQLAIRSLQLENIDDAVYAPGTIDCVDLKLISPDLPWGRLSARAGEAAYQYLEAAARLAVDGRVAAICTAPLNKEALQAAGHKFPGHTELLAHLTGTPEVSMMLVTPKLRVLHVTTHIGLIDAIAMIEPGLVERTIARGHAALEKIGIANPRIGVCGINPHAGENGLFGHGEEEQKIVPAITRCRARGWNVEGPLPADTLFYRAQRGDFDLVIAMYHDQGHGPVKVLGLESGVNITIGLPVVRTSVDHGTAFDIAGTGKADERSLIEAIRQAVGLAPREIPS
jgi:4-hydroxythreonine-4-phosphate dehydrogenase